jgi:hypothetical protein
MINTNCLGQTQIQPSEPTQVIDIKPKVWRDVFPRLGQLKSGEPVYLIERFLSEGATFLGSLSGVGKTWVALAMAKALRTGLPFLGLFKVPQVVPVVYLVPEMGGRAIRRRAETLGIPDSDEFRLWTLQEGILKLNNPYLAAMIRELKPVVFLDTAIRFLSGDENSSSENNAGLAEAIFSLLRNGARAVVALHHSPKNASKAGMMTLENVLRGTGDLGAMAEVVWGIERARKKRGKQWDSEYARESYALTRLHLQLVKGREDDNMVGDLVIQGRPFIAENGDFRVLECDEMVQKIDDAVDRGAKLVAAIEADKKASLRQLSKVTGWNTSVARQKALSLGWRPGGDGWEQIVKPEGIQTLDLSEFAFDPALDEG